MDATSTFLLSVWYKVHYHLLQLDLPFRFICIQIYIYIFHVEQ